MCEQKLHFVTTSTRKRKRQIFKPDHRIVHAGQPESRAILLEAHAFVYQNTDPFSAKQVGYQRGIDPVVVIPQYGINAISGFQSTQHLRARCSVLSLFGDVIACENDDVGLEPVRGLDGLLDLFLARKRAVMNVGKLHDAKAVEGGR